MTRYRVTAIGHTHYVFEVEAASAGDACAIVEMDEGDLEPISIESDGGYETGGAAAAVEVTS